MVWAVNTTFLLLIIFSLAYIVMIVFFIRGLEQEPKKISKKEPTQKISVVVAVKNEQSHIKSFLNRLCKQNYPQNLLEIIIVDYSSASKTYQLLEKYEEKIDNLKVFSTREKPTRYYGKKSALDWGIRQANGEFILTTDVNCKMGPNWAQTIVQYFDEMTDMVVGFSSIKPDNSFLSKWQAVDYLLLMSGACGALKKGQAWGASAQNLAFRKKVYYEIGGYNQLEDIAAESGSLFLQVVRNNSYGRIRFAHHPDAWVESVPIENFSKFLSQRIRWAIEAKLMYRFNFKVFAGDFITLILNLLFPLVFILGFVEPGLFIIWACFGLLKYITEYLLFEKGIEKFDQKYLKDFFPYWFITQIPYAIVVGVAGIFKKKE